MALCNIAAAFSCDTGAMMAHVLAVLPEEHDRVVLTATAFVTFEITSQMIKICCIGQITPRH
jgi:hypothetical protein